MKRAVKNHSAPLSTGPQRSDTEPMLSSMTATTLRPMAHNSTTSKALPALVSASKTIFQRRSRVALRVGGVGSSAIWPILAGSP